MTDLDKDDNLTESATVEGKRRQLKLLPKPLLRLILLLAGIVIVVVVIVVVVTSTTGGDEAADYETYMTGVADILEQSDALGAELNELLTNPGDTTRAKIQGQLDQYLSTSERLELEAKALAAPNAFIEQNVHQFFVMVMTFRHTGLTDLKPSLMNALEVQDTEVASEQISRSLYYLTNSDFLYREVFIPKATEILTEQNIDGVIVPDTVFMSDPDIASKVRVQEILASLKSTGNLQAVHGVAVAKVVAMPDEKEIEAGGTYNLQSSDELAFLVTVENQGNMAEKNVPVVVTLQEVDATEPQKVTVEIPEMKPNEEQTVTVEGLNPTAYGEVALLRVEVGPVKDEKYNDNNLVKADVIFTL
jgi:CARDB